MFGLFQKKSSKVEFRKARVAVAEPPAVEDVKALERASEVLKYRPSLAIDRRTELQNILAELEIDVLDTAQVRKYIESKNYEGDKSFREYELESYTQPIPIHVLHKAMQIKDRMPSVEFFVHAYEDRYTSHSAGDPFLEVRSSYSTDPQRIYTTRVIAVSYFIEVWDEPGFEGRTTK